VPPAADATPLVCLLCGGAAERRCGKCKAVAYCSRDHQAKDCHRHKVACREPSAMRAVQASPASAARGAISSALGPDLARLVQAAVPCSRCKRSVGEAGPCRVPHPASKRRFQQGMSKAGTNITNYGCEACGCNYSVVIDSHNGTERVEGAQWCYEAAEHVVGPLPAVDCRRVDDDAVELVSDGQLQRRIDALPATTRVLTIGD
jgi:hypothetical protein